MFKKKIKIGNREWKKFRSNTIQQKRLKNDWNTLETLLFFFLRIARAKQIEKCPGQFSHTIQFCNFCKSINRSVSEPVVTSMTNVTLTTNPSNVKIAQHQKIKKCPGQFVHNIFWAILEIKDSSGPRKLPECFFIVSWNYVFFIVSCSNGGPFFHRFLLPTAGSPSFSPHFLGPEGNVCLKSFPGPGCQSQEATKNGLNVSWAH